MGERARSEIKLRILSAAVLAPVAIGAAWVGSAVYAAFLGFAALLMIMEWVRLVGGQRKPYGYWLGAFGIIFSLSAGLTVGPVSAFAVLGVAILFSAVASKLSGGSALWVWMGTAYVGLPIICLAILRGGSDIGFVATIWLLALVWSADSSAFVVGRLVKGPRLAPRISPNKTWAGAIAAVVAATMVGLATAKVLGDTSVIGLGAASAVVGVAAVVGDLIESALKRRFGAKDTGSLIPGHGGVMDRADSLAAAAVVTVFLGLSRGGINGVAEGVLEW